MGTRIPEVDAYIAKSGDFAKPIMTKLRDLFHQAHPQIQEKIKWGSPTFEHKGIVAAMSAFKKHMTFGFWKGKLMNDLHESFEGMGNTDIHSIKLSELADLPPDAVLISHIQQAVALNETGVKQPRTAKKEQPELVVPVDLSEALAGDEKARVTFEGFSYSNRRDYIAWLTEAKREATRAKRLGTTLEWLAEGKPRNWKYMKEYRT